MTRPLFPLASAGAALLTSQDWKAPMKITGSTRVSFRLTFQYMCGLVALSVALTLPSTPPRGIYWPSFTSIFDRWQNVLMES